MEDVKRERPGHNWKCYLGICPEGLRKITKKSATAAVVAVDIRTSQEALLLSVLCRQLRNKLSLQINKRLGNKSGHRLTIRVTVQFSETTEQWFYLVG
jgi:hypothetical protein